jgi:ribulose-phosphate 3-epimerase
MEPEIIPAILVKDRAELLSHIARVKDHVKTIQIDIMDDDFVPNKTIGLEELKDLPEASYEFHWMVKDPVRWIESTPGDHMHLVHVETIMDIKEVKEAVRKAGGRLGLALNPDTPVESILPYLDEVGEVLVMTVHPGFSGQGYIKEMEEKVKRLRGLRTDLDIEVDGGINIDTIGCAYAAGANLLAAASAVFKPEDTGKAVEELKRRALSGCPE